MKKFLATFLINAMNSLVTTVGGSVIGLGVTWAGLRDIIDGDPLTEGSWKVVGAGVLTIIIAWVAKDHTKGIVDPRKEK